MSKFAETARAAREAGLSYGLWRAFVAPDDKTPDRDDKTRDRRRQRPKKRTWTDEQAFDLWQKRMTDGEIGAALGVSKTVIQRWRSALELPSLWKCGVNTKKYRLIRTKDGVYAVDIDNI